MAVGAMRAKRRGKGRLENIEVSDPVREVLAHLNPEGAQQFVTEMLGALAEAKKTDDVEPINDVITSWYRTMLFIDKEGFDEAHDRAHDPSRKRKPRALDDVLKR